MRGFEIETSWEALGSLPPPCLLSFGRVQLLAPTTHEIYPHQIDFKSSWFLNLSLSFFSVIEYSLIHLGDVERTHISIEMLEKVNFCCSPMFQ